MPESMDMYTLYHYNSTDTTVRDMDENCYARTSVVFEPLSIIIYDMDGNEVATVTGDKKKRTDGFEVRISGEKYGTVYYDKSSNNDAFYLDGPDGRFRLESSGRFAGAISV